jgi:hypothetical protein
MRCTSLAVLLAAPLIMACPSIASAQAPPHEWFWGCNNGSSFGASLTARLNQHGPLFNYGPYYGYPPFEPYGPWNAYLQYNPWYYGVPAPHVHGSHGDLSGHGPLCTGEGLSWHSSWLHGGWYHGCSTCSYGGLFTSQGGWIRGYFTPSCKTCGITGSVSEIAAPTKVGFDPETTDPLARCAGVGNPADFAGFYSGLPTLDLTAVPAESVAK